MTLRVVGLLLLILGTAVLPYGWLAAGEGPPDVSKPVDYTTDVAPLLAQHCARCHGAKTQKGQLQIDAPEGLVKGGDSGEPLFVAGKSDKSQLVERVTSDDPNFVMPPEGKRLSESEIALLKRWIDEGARLPEERKASQKSDHWSFQPLAKVEPPVLSDSFVRNAIDSFILAKLREKGLRPSPEADKVTRIRRLALDLHGLPPTPEEVERFVKDDRPDAWTRLVDQMLASPRYGERWGRHWLDVIRFAETNGFETNRERTSAWHFRDYVIRALNEDKPYNQFVREQLAGDALDVQIGTGFLVAGPYDIVKSPDKNLTLMQRQDELADMVNTTGTTFLGLTLGCARCHNHKFDPITQKDFYAVQAVFAGVNQGEREIPVAPQPDSVAQLAAQKQQLDETAQRLAALRQMAESERKRGSTPDKELRPAVNPKTNEELLTPVAARWVRMTIRATNNGAEPCLDEFEVYDASGNNVALASAGAIPTASGSLPGYEIHQLKHLNDGQVGNSHSWISNVAGTGWVQLELRQPVEIQRIVWGRDRLGQFPDRVPTDYLIEIAVNPGEWQAVASSATRRKGVSSESEEAAFVALLPVDLQKEATSLLGRHRTLSELVRRRSAGSDVAWVGSFRQPEPTYRLYRGDPLAPREVTAPDAVESLGTLGLAVDTPEQLRRVKLADWIVRNDNPLSARVLVNRLWQYHFGTGIVDTPNDFGANGTPPSHPALLDWMAAEFMRNNWSLKRMHRLILLSSTYQQDNAPRPEAVAVDAGTRLLWRFPPRRLEAEALRDSILAASGVLDLTMGGPGFSAFDVQLENVRHYFPKKTFGPADWRRMVYMTKVRSEQDAIFGVFDCPDGSQVAPKRSRSTTPLQALNLLNSPFMTQQAQLLASRLRREAGDDTGNQIRRAYSLLYSRFPVESELHDARDLAGQYGLEAVCRALLNTNEFLFLF